jgi:hypothetical protein
MVLILTPRISAASFLENKTIPADSFLYPMLNALVINVEKGPLLYGVLPRNLVKKEGGWHKPPLSTGSVFLKR